MRIIYATTAIVPCRLANSIHVMKMCQAFREMGHEVELVVPTWPHLEDIQPGVDIWTLYGIHHHFPISRRKWSKPAAGLDFAYSAYSYARQKKVDLLFTRNLAVAAISSLRGMPTVLEYHRPVVSPFRWQVFRKFGGETRPMIVALGILEHLLLQFAIRGSGFRKLVVISGILKGLILEQLGGKLEDNDVMVCPDAIDLERFDKMLDPPAARAKLALPAQQVTFGYAGQLYEGFGIELLLHLARLLTEAQFVVIGGDEEYIARWRQKKAQLGVENINFFGFVPNAVVPDYLAACDILLMPYQRKVTIAGKGDTSLWMSPMKMFEYMATGRMIISSDLPVLREVLNDRNAALCPPDDEGVWLRAAQKAVSDPTWRGSLGRQARADAEKYTWKCRVARILKEALG